MTDSGVSRETLGRLNAYANLLLQWNQKINLIARGDEANLWNRHIDDALQLIPLMPPAVERAVDIGSGAGFPGLVLAIATTCRFTLIESDARKAAFLHEAIRALEAPAQVIAERAERCAVDPVALVTARAVAPLGHQLELAIRFLSPGGLCIFPKGKAARIELTQAREQWQMRADHHPSRTDPAASILVLSEIWRVGSETSRSEQ